MSIRKGKAVTWCCDEVEDVEGRCQSIMLDDDVRMKNMMQSSRHLDDRSTSQSYFLHEDGKRQGWTRRRRRQ